MSEQRQGNLITIQQRMHFKAELIIIVILFAFYQSSGRHDAEMGRHTS